MILIPGPRLGSLRNLVKMGSIADSVLPLAVGEIRSTFFPSRMGGIAFSCASVALRNPRSLTASARGRGRRPKTLDGNQHNEPADRSRKTEEGYGCRSFVPIKPVVTTNRAAREGPRR